MANFSLQSHARNAWRFRHVPRGHEIRSPARFGADISSFDFKVFRCVVFLAPSAAVEVCDGASSGDAGAMPTTKTPRPSSASRPKPLGQAGNHGIQGGSGGEAVRRWATNFGHWSSRSHSPLTSGFIVNSLSAPRGGEGWGEVGVAVHPMTRSTRDLRPRAMDAQGTHQYIAAAIDQSPTSP